MNTHLAFYVPVGRFRRYPVSISDKRICFALLAESGRRAVTRHEYDFVAEWPQLLFDGGDQCGVIALREIGASD